MFESSPSDSAPVAVRLPGAYRLRAHCEGDGAHAGGPAGLSGDGARFNPSGDGREVGEIDTGLL